MGFTWTTISQGDPIEAAHLNEIKNNTDSVLTDLSTSWTWTNFPVAAGGFIENVDVQELRDAIDYADDQNYCKSENNSLNSSIHSTYNDVIDVGDAAPYYGTNCSSLHSSYQIGVDYSVQAGLCGTYNAYVTG